MQQQHGGVDCSQFAIAFATELAHGKDPVGVSYAQSAMGDHFLLSLENRKVEPFSCARKPAIRNIVSIALYCVCKLPEAANMVCCDLCNNWYRYHCVGLQEQEDLPGFASIAKLPRKKKTVSTLSFVNLYIIFKLQVILWCSHCCTVVLLVFHEYILSCICVRKHSEQRRKKHPRTCAPPEKIP